MRALAAASACAVLAQLLTTACGISIRAVESTPAAIGPLRCVAVLPFTNASGVDRAGMIVAEDMANELLASGELSVLEPLESARLLEALGAPDSPPSQADVLQRYANAMGVDAVLAGTVSRFEPRNWTAPRDDEPAPLVSYACKLVEAATGRVLWAASVGAHDNPVLLGLPQSRGDISRDTAAALARTLLGGRARERVSDRGVCWSPPPSDVTADSEAPPLDDRRHSEYFSTGGETLRALARRFLLNPARLDLLQEANPDVEPDRVLLRGTRVRIPRYLDRQVMPGDTLAALARQELGHAAYSTLIFWRNRRLLAGPGQEASSQPRYGVVIDARQRWSLFDVLGSVADQFVVVNGVPRIFPRVQTRLRWLVYGRKLPMRNKGVPAVETFFENKVEIPEYAEVWWLEIRDSKGNVRRVMSGEGAPPERLDWDGQLDEGQHLQEGETYQYSLQVEYQEGTRVTSPLEAFGAGARAEAPRVDPDAKISGRSMPVAGGRFIGRFSTELLSGVMPVELVAEDGASGTGQFTIPSVTVLRPTKLEILEVGVSNDVYQFPAIPLVDGRFDLAALDRTDITFTLTGRTEPSNEVIIDGDVIEVGEMGVFQATLHLKRGENLFSLLVRSPEGSQTFLEEQIVLRTRGPAGEPWEFSTAERDSEGAVRADDPLQAGVVLEIPLLRVPLGPRHGIREALFDATPLESIERHDAEPTSTDAAAP